LGDPADKSGAAGYMVSVIGKRVLYFGVNGEAHVECFPGAGPKAN
jgi:hypothetical protein